ncbi:hypothetical protein NDU88_008449 [Pleurodeles waltl]|uniref:Uncharacterized protein n=1 Tax=Pleurodeles waltl TaxID=8319 RepID=A0AAV7RXQ0_PLEWA|nr:hypothetical protein NDU88_008449 [Pleurodeles waltl]
MMVKAIGVARDNRKIILFPQNELRCALGVSDPMPLALIPHTSHKIFRNILKATIWPSVISTSAAGSWDTYLLLTSRTKVQHLATYGLSTNKASMARAGLINSNF